MNHEQWTAVDHYFSDRLLAPDSILEAALENNAAMGLPPIDVTAHQGKLLMLLARSHGARSILEIGTLGAYSTIWLARALPEDGRLVSLELEDKHAVVARANIERAGLTDKVEIRVGAAIESLPRLVSEAHPPFDFVFIDADKQSTADYFEWALKLTRRGSVIIVDNVVRGGAVTDATSNDPSILGIRRFMERLAAEPRVSATAIQTVGSKGYDGFVLALVTADP